jgi:DNA-binding MarR family transcriptional regulator
MENDMLIEPPAADRRNDHRRMAPVVVAWMRLARIYHRIDRRTADTMRQHGITVSRFDVINHAGAVEGRTQQQIADSLLVTKGNITQLVDAMEADGLLVRRREGRTKRIFLTDMGRCVREELVRVQEEAIVRDWAALDPDEVQALLHLLRKLDQSIGKDNINDTR